MSNGVALDEKVENLRMCLPARVTAQLKRDFVLPDYKSITASTPNGKIEPMELYTAKEAAAIRDAHKLTIRSLLESGQISYVYYKGRRYIPGHELARLMDVPVLHEFYDKKDAQWKYGIRPETFDKLIAIAFIKGAEEGMIPGDKMFALYHLLLKLTNKKPTMIPRKEWHEYKREGMPFAESRESSKKRVPLKTILTHPELAPPGKFFSKVPRGSYVSILFISRDTVSLYYIPVCGSQTSPWDNTSIRNNFADLFDYYRRTQDPSAKILHYKGPFEGHYIGALQTKLEERLLNLVHGNNVYILLSNSVKHGGMLNAKGLDLVGRVDSHLRAVHENEDRLQSLNKKNPFSILLKAGLDWATK